MKVKLTREIIIDDDMPALNVGEVIDGAYKLNTNEVHFFYGGGMHAVRIGRDCEVVPEGVQLELKEQTGLPMQMNFNDFFTQEMESLHVEFKRNK